MTEFFMPSTGTIIFGLGIIDRLIPHVRIGSLSAQLDYPNKTVAVIIPVHNGEKNLDEVIKSIKNQSRRADRIIVADDASTDATSFIAHYNDVKYIRSDQHLGRAGILNLAVKEVQEDIVLTLDDDTTLHPDFIRELLPVFYRPEVAVACGFVIPNVTETTGITGNIIKGHRLVQYIFGQEFVKRGQLLLNGVIVSAGCCSMFRTDVIKKIPFKSRNMVEDMDLTWELQEKGFQAGFAPNAIASTIEPHNLEEYMVQGTRWFGGFWNNLHDHSGAIFKDKGLGASIIFAVAEVAWLPIFYGLIGFQLLSGNFISVGIMLGLDMGLVALAVLYKGRKLGKTKELLKSLPSTFLMRFYDSWLWIATSIKYGLLNRRVKIWNIDDREAKKYKLKRCSNCNKYSAVPCRLWAVGEMTCRNKNCQSKIIWKS